MLAVKKPDSFQIVQEKAKIPVVEIFGPTIQGEGSMAGSQTHFLRTGGCDFRCSWCDSMYAVEPEQVKANSTKHTQLEIFNLLMERGEQSGVHTLTISGGNPAIHNLGGLVRRLQEEMWKVAVETQGSIWRDWLGIVDVLTLSSKPPSASAWNGDTSVEGCLNPVKYFVQQYRYANDHNVAVRKPRNKEICFKVVIKTEEDFEFFKLARNYMLMLEPLVPVRYYIQPMTYQELEVDPIETLLEDTRRWADRLLTSQMGDVRLMPQMHVLLWGRQKGV